MAAGTDTYQVLFDNELNCVVMKWDGYSTSAEFRAGTELMLETLVRHQTDRVLADIRDMVLIGMNDQQWLHTDFLPRAISSGFRTIAIIWPEHYFNKVAVESISDKVDQDKIAINFFNNLPEARARLKTFSNENPGR